MKKIRIITDSSSDIPLDIARELDILIVPLYVGYGGDMYKDNIEIGHDDVFDALIEGKKVNTAAPSPGDFFNTFDNIFKEDRDSHIICITLSSRLSGSFNSANIAANMLPGFGIDLVDSKTSTLSLGLIPVQAAIAVKRGYALEEVLGLIYKLIDRNKFIAVLGSFEYVFKGGRTAFFGNILSKAFILTPVLTIGRSGKVHLKRFSRNRKSALDYIRDNAISIAKEYKRVNLGLFYGKDPKPMESIKDAFLTSTELKVERIIENKITTVISAHTGPDLWGIAVSPAIV